MVAPQTSGASLAVRVAVVLAVRNGERFLERAIRSVLSEPISELIIVDDGSTDGTRELADRIVRQCRWATAIHTEPLGVSHARNLGLQRTHAEWIALMDADDIWVPGKTLKQLQALNGNRRAVACSKVNHYVEPGEVCPPTLRQDKLGVIDLFFPSNLLAHRQVFEVVGGFDESLVCANDIDWYRRAFALGIEKVHVDEVLVQKSVHTTNLSMSQGHDMQKQILRVVSRKVEPRMFPVLRHSCARPPGAKSGSWGSAYDSVGEQEDGRFYITNGEYGTDVNFCPVCGMKAWKEAG